MKTHLLSMMVLIGTISSSAQITLTHFHSFDVGTTGTFTRIEAPNIDLSVDGENQVWEASKLAGSYSYDHTESYVDPSESPVSEIFPEANVAFTIAFNRYDLYEDTQTELMHVGAGDPGFSITTYSDPKTILKFPMDYGDSFVDDFELVITYDQGYSPWTAIGSIEVTADAYGDLNLPYGTIENTIRLKTIESSIESNEKYDDYIVFHTYYTWYDLEYGNKIAIYEERDYGFGPETYFMYVSEKDYTAIKEQRETSALTVYPNPVSDSFQISGADSGSEYKLINQQGQEVLSGTINGEERIYIAEFSTGIYFLEIKNDLGVSRKKISIQ